MTYYLGVHVRTPVLFSDWSVSKSNVQEVDKQPEKHGICTRTRACALAWTYVDDFDRKLLTTSNHVQHVIKIYQALPGQRRSDIT